MTWFRKLFGRSPTSQKPDVPPAPDYSTPIRSRDCSEDPKPHFRFFPGAYESDVMQESDEQCSLCGCQCGWRYVGSIYSAEEPPAVCARCIADGTLGTTLVDAMPSENVNRELWDECSVCTPGMSTWNPFQWPVVNGEPLVYLGHCETKELARTPEIIEAAKQYDDKWGWDDHKPTAATMAFRSLDGRYWRTFEDLC